MESLGKILENRHGKVKVIAVRGNPRAVIVRTTTEAAPDLRGQSGLISLAGKQVAAVQTSGVIGKLKKRATGGETSRLGEVPQ